MKTITVKLEEKNYENLASSHAQISTIALKSQKGFAGLSFKKILTVVSADFSV